jgi:flagellar basal body-associated protein FliL
MKGGSPVGIIIGVVAAVVIIGGGAAWYLHDKKKKADAEKNGDAAGFSDDCYAAFVDVERQ